MIEKSDKRRLFLLVDRYLIGEKSPYFFCEEYRESYNLVLLVCVLSTEEQALFSEIHNITSKFCDDEDEIKKQKPSLFYTKQELKQKITTAKQRSLNCWQDTSIDFVKIVLDPKRQDYFYEDSSSISMDILAFLLIRDVDCRINEASFTALQEWALNDDLGYAMSSNSTLYEKEGSYIHLRDLHSNEEISIKVTMLRSKFVELIDEWQDKVCKNMPKKVILKHQNGEFFIETQENNNNKPTEFEELASKRITVALEHILGMQLKISDQGAVVVEGFCHDSMGYIDKNKFFELVDRIDLPSGAYGGQLIYQGLTVKHKASFFPSDWSRKKVIENIYVAYNNFIKNGVEAEFKCGKYHITGETKEGMKIRMHIATNGEIKSAYPVINNI
jgi:hypothetical protein